MKQIRFHSQNSRIGMILCSCGHNPDFHGEDRTRCQYSEYDGEKWTSCQCHMWNPQTPANVACGTLQQEKKRKGGKL